MYKFHFRGWDEHIKRFWYSDLFLGMVDPEKRKSYTLYASSVSLSDLEISSNMKDIKNTYIFQGDICSVIINNNKYNLEVIWDDDRAGLRLKGRYENSHVELNLTIDSIIDNNIEVIGNIHESVELLIVKDLL